MDSLISDHIIEGQFYKETKIKTYEFNIINKIYLLTLRHHVIVNFPQYHIQNCLNAGIPF